MHSRLGRSAEPIHCHMHAHMFWLPLAICILLQSEKSLAISSNIDSIGLRPKKCEALGLCSMGHVKPFLGDIYNSEYGAACGVMVIYMVLF